jgi:thioesterase domain-containing protein
VAALHIAQMRSVQPKGPYRVGGFCNGAVAMYEVAQQLARAGEQVEMLILLDPPSLYFYILRQHVMNVCQTLGLPEDQSRLMYQRIAEVVEIWRDHGALVFLKTYALRLFWRIARIFQKPMATRPKLDFHYYEALAKYAPVPYLQKGRVMIILREKEKLRHPKQIQYWSSFIPEPRVEVVEGTHLEFKSSLEDISRVIREALEFKS